MNLPRLLFLPLLFAILLAQVAMAQGEYPQDIARRLQNRYDHMESLNFHFNQQVTGQMAGRDKAASGEAWFLKSTDGGRMRWNYVNPQQVLVSDGQKFSMYFQELKQMIVSNADSLDQELTYAFFSGRGNLERDFYILPANEEYGLQDNQGKGAKIIKLVPKKDQAQVEDIHLWVNADSLIERIVLRDHLDTRTTLTFSAVRPNALSGLTSAEVKQLFSFSPPAGTEIIRQ
ncbi:MAG: outer membrane lipoprotein carrier protein LolA [Desulfobulbaceae bacterium]|jgi:outer membrane lipoprotein carrier protein|nr:outer membrane lipoprotein carrier protein LolA [Desulfobulbaceae bacterium]